MDEVLKKLIERAELVAANEARCQVSYGVSEILRVCESPIEQKFAVAMVNSEAPAYFELSLLSQLGSARVAFQTRLDHVKYLEMTRSAALSHCEFVTLFPQQKIGKYRVDFVLLARLGFDQQTVKIVIECDGHDFHERTKEQAQRDKSRDRFLHAAGYTVYRFTGSEIHADAEACAREVVGVLESIAHKEPDEGEN